PRGTLIGGCRRLGCRLSLLAFRQDIATIDPDLDTDLAHRRRSVDDAIVDVGAERVTRHTAVGLGHASRHFGATQPTAQADLDALGPPAHGLADRVLHRPAIGDTTAQLLGDRLSDQPGVQLGDL